MRSALQEITCGRPGIDHRHLLQVMPAAAYTCDAHGLITYFNDRAERIWGRAPRLNDPADRWCGSFKLVTLDGDPLPHEDCWMARAVKHRRCYHEREIVIERPDGRRLIALAHATPFFAPDGTLTGAVNVLLDITERKAHEVRAMESEGLLRAAIDSLSSHTVVLSGDGTIISVNRAWRDFAMQNGGESTKVLEGANYLEACDRAARSCREAAQIGDAVRAVLAGDAEPPPVEYACHALHEQRWFLCTVRGLPRPHQRLAVVSHLNVTAVKTAEAQVRKLSTVVEQTPASVVITDTAGRIQYVNPAFTRTSGYTPEEVLGRNPRLLKSGRMPGETYKQIWTDLVAGRVWRGELQNRHKDGSLFWELAVISPIRNAAGETTEYMAVKENITRRKEIEDALRAAARTDKLTGLFNRAVMHEKLRCAVRRAQESPEHHFALLYFDVDRFKLINDSFGHEIGDRLLREVADRIRAAVPAFDVHEPQTSASTTAARLGGDEFVVLMDALRSSMDACVVGEQLLEALSKPYRIEQHEIHLSASIGIATSDITPESAESVLRDADTAMYEAKLAGKNRVVVFDISMRRRTQLRIAIEQALRDALSERQLHLLYQPIIVMQTGEVESVEALLRWTHPELGNVPPSQFVPIAEESGQARGLPAPGSVGINLSRIQLQLRHLPCWIRSLLEETGVPAASLHLEVTESAIMRDVETSHRVLKSIRNMGVQIHMDDFGTGYSSLSSLHEFPIDVLKIDRSLVAKLQLGREFAAQMNAVIELAHNLDIKVVAEGIETPEQVAVLQALGCELGQGYFFSKPLPAQSVPEFCRVSRQHAA